MSLKANWSYPTAIRFGAGRISEIAEACLAAGISKPLLVTDRGLADMEITTKTLNLVEQAGLGRAMFSDVDPNPNEKNVEEGLKVYREGGFDGVIAFGGGSGLDLAKTLAFMAGQSRTLWDFEDIGDWWTRADPAGIHPCRPSNHLSALNGRFLILSHPRFRPNQTNKTRSRKTTKPRRQDSGKLVTTAGVSPLMHFGPLARLI